MTEQQKIHIAMMNSYNVLTGKCSIEDIFNSDVPMFSHVIDDEPNQDNVLFIIKYFEKIDMFEQCLELKQYITDTFDDEGNITTKICPCPYPEITEYSFNTKCNICKQKLRY